MKKPMIRSLDPIIGFAPPLRCEAGGDAVACQY